MAADKAPGLCMALNKACIGKQYPPVKTAVTLEAIQQYARAYNDNNPRFLDHKAPGGIVAPPMFGVTVTWLSLIGAMADPEVRADLLRLLHSAQEMEFVRPIRPGDVISSTAKVISIESAPNGETMAVELDATSDNNEPVGKTVFTVFIRGRRDSGRNADPRAAAAPDRGPALVTVAQTIDKDQTFRYAEASGDLNPIHIDENVAKMAGLPGVIVHGLCTMAFTSKVMIDHLCDGDPTRLKRLAVRFSRPVFPGDTITTRVWSDGERGARRIYAYETLNPDGLAVIRHGLAEVAS
ncbi:MAG: MaoC/PaaZ C-terminal domain-containing protein [Candidatus Binataceae bacterium]